MKQMINILDIEGKEKGKIEIPACFSKKIREDIIAKVLETKKIYQPFAPSLVAGKQHSASGKMRHRRHVWQTHYGRGMSRIPRKVMSRRGTQFNWVGAEVASTVGGRRAHPPRAISRINTKKINKKEFQIALLGAISATANSEKIIKKYNRLNKKNIKEVPIIVESKITHLKVKDLLKSLKKILGEKLFDIAIKNKTIRSGKGKQRGRKYKKSAGLLLVVGEKEKLNTNTFDVVNVVGLGINDLAKGGPGRLTIYTENAIKYLEEKLK